MNVHISFIKNLQNLETTKMSYNRPTGKQTVVHAHNGILLNNRT